jgi:hypothetical protein
MLANRIPIHFNADPKKVILLYLDPGESERLPRFASFSHLLSDEEADNIHQHTLSLFGHRHRNFNGAVLENADKGLMALNDGTVLNAKQKWSSDPISQRNILLRRPHSSIRALFRIRIKPESLPEKPNLY